MPAYKHRKESYTHIDKPAPAQWNTCNRCGYGFRKKANGEVDGQDVIRHKQECQSPTASRSAGSPSGPRDPL